MGLRVVFKEITLMVNSVVSRCFIKKGVPNVH